MDGRDFFAGQHREDAADKFFGTRQTGKVLGETADLGATYVVGSWHNR